MKLKMERRNFLKGSAITSAALFAGIKPTSLWGKEKNHAPLLSNSDNETLKTIHNLRTIHGNFSEKPISQNDIDTILQASIQAANSSAMQTYSIVTIKDPDRMEKICGYKGAALLLYCIDYNRNIASANFHNQSYTPEGIQAFITGSTNTILALQTAIIAAKSLGIDSLPTNGVHRGDMARIWKELELPEKYCFPLIALVLGYAKDEPQFNKGRLDGPGVFHNEKYHLPNEKELTEITAKYDDDNLHLGLNNTWKKKYNHYLDWLYSKWPGGKSKPLKKESQAFKILKRVGFVDLQNQ